MNILFTTEIGSTRDIYFPEQALHALAQLGKVTFNPKNSPLEAAELADLISGIDVCLTHWGCPQFSDEVMERADRLKLIAHAAGSVGNLVTAQVYERGIAVCSANTIMAKEVAEGVLAYFLAGLRLIPQHDRGMKSGRMWERQVVESQGLAGKKIGLVGLGTVGRFLLDLLAPFGVQVKVYDPYITADVLPAYPWVEVCADLDEVIGWGEVVSLHASLTPTTRGMIGRAQLQRIRDGALLVNTARGAVIDEGALVEALSPGRFNTVLDVYETEPLPLESPLRTMENVILMPHMAGITAREQMTFGMLDEIERFSKGEALKYEIPYRAFTLMTKES